MGNGRGGRELAMLVGEVAVLWLLRPLLSFAGDAVARAAANRSGSWPPSCCARSTDDPETPTGPYA